MNWIVQLCEQIFPPKKYTKEEALQMRAERLAEINKSQPGLPGYVVFEKDKRWPDDVPNGGFPDPEASRRFAKNIFD